MVDLGLWKSPVGLPFSSNAFQTHSKYSETAQGKQTEVRHQRTWSSRLVDINQALAKQLG